MGCHPTTPKPWLDAGLVDVLVLHLAPVALDAGTPLFTGGAPPATPRTIP